MPPLARRLPVSGLPPCKYGWARGDRAPTRLPMQQLFPKGMYTTQLAQASLPVSPTGQSPLPGWGVRLWARARFVVPVGCFSD